MSSKSSKTESLDTQVPSNLMESIKHSVPKGAISLGEYDDMISSSAILKAMQKCDISDDPTDAEKLREVFNTPELMARAISLIVSRQYRFRNSKKP